MDVSAVQFRKAESPMVVTESGRRMVVSAVHPSNIAFGTAVGDPPSVTVVRLSHPAKALALNFSTVAGMVTSVRPPQSWKTFAASSVTPSGMLISVRAAHPLKACPPIETTVPGISKRSDVQPQKA